LGGAVALEMALQRPESVPRLALINSLASYRIDHWRKWLEARVPALLIALFGMKRVAQMFAARLFPHPWQKSMRDRAATVVGAVSAVSYLGILKALERWTVLDRLPRLLSRTLIIAAEHDFTTVAEKRLLARRIMADIVVVQGSRHGTPFDSVGSTNACLLAFLMDRPLPSIAAWTCDEPSPIVPLAFAGSLAEEHELGRLGPGVNM
jgi:pimeloyl-ACP methyl ester carboxylesterase